MVDVLDRKVKVVSGGKPLDITKLEGRVDPSALKKLVENSNKYNKALDTAFQGESSGFKETDREDIKTIDVDENITASLVKGFDGETKEVSNESANDDTVNADDITKSVSKTFNDNQEEDIVSNSIDAAIVEKEKVDAKEDKASASIAEAKAQKIVEDEIIRAEEEAVSKEQSGSTSIVDVIKEEKNKDEKEPESLVDAIKPSYDEAKAKREKDELSKDSEELEKKVLDAKIEKDKTINSHDGLDVSEPDKLKVEERPSNTNNQDVKKDIPKEIFVVENSDITKEKEPKAEENISSNNNSINISEKDAAKIIKGLSEGRVNSQKQGSLQEQVQDISKSMVDGVAKTALGDEKGSKVLDNLRSSEVLHDYQNPKHLEQEVPQENNYSVQVDKDTKDHSIRQNNTDIEEISTKEDGKIDTNAEKAQKEFENAQKDFQKAEGKFKDSKSGLDKGSSGAKPKLSELSPGKKEAASLVAQKAGLTSERAEKLGVVRHKPTKTINNTGMDMDVISKMAHSESR